MDDFPYTPAGGLLLARRFWAHVDIGGPDECWPWARGMRTGPYGLFDGTTASRVAYQIATGVQLERKEQVLHSCDNPPCCNPAHLRVGSQSTNMKEMWARIRSGRPPRIIRDPKGSGRIVGTLPEEDRV